MDNPRSSPVLEEEVLTALYNGAQLFCFLEMHHTPLAVYRSHFGVCFFFFLHTQVSQSVEQKALVLKAWNRNFYFWNFCWNQRFEKKLSSFNHPRPSGREFKSLIVISGIAVTNLLSGRASESAHHVDPEKHRAARKNSHVLVKKIYNKWMIESLNYLANSLQLLMSSSEILVVESHSFGI
jgi:hypothetical protein